MLSSRRPACRVLHALPYFVLAGLAAPSAHALFLHQGQTAAPASAVENAKSKVENPKEEWVGMYFGAQKVGFSRSRTTPTMFQGRPAEREAETSSMKIQVFGATVEENSTSVTIKDAKGRPLTEKVDMTSNSGGVHAEATYDYAAHKILCRIGTGRQAVTKTLTFPADAQFGSESDFLPKGDTVKIGQKFTVYALDPAQAQLKIIKVEIIGQESVTDDTGKTVQAVVAKADMGIGDTKVWATPDGQMIKTNIAVGPVTITAVSESKEHALDTAYLSPALGTSGANGTASGSGTTNVPALDIADATAISINRPLPRPRAIRALHLKIEGVPDEKYIVSDARQKETVTKTDGGAPYTLDTVLEAAPFDPAQSAKLPVTNTALGAYTQKTAYLDTTDPKIQATAKTLRGTETNLYKIAANVRNWVNAQMTPDPSVGVLRSATDVYTNRRGVCRDYATLFTGVARAAGVPTRICGGIVYGQGKFFYHAWAECWVGRWVAFDPTLYDRRNPVEYVDATHIKFAQGDVTDMFGAVGVVGKLKITVQD